MRLILFDHAEKPVKIITDVLDGHEESEINAAAQLSLTLDMQAVSQADLEATAFIAIPRPHQPNNQFNMYAVQSFSNDGHAYSVTGVDQFNFELSGYGYIPTKRMPKASLADVTNTIFGGTRWRVADQDQVPESAIYFNYNSRIEAVKKMVAAFGVEVEHYYVVKDNRITDRVVNIKKQVGEDTFRRFVYGDNALSVVREEARDSIYTAAVGRGKGEEKTDDEGNSTGGYGRKITFSDVVWSKANGDPVDKPAGQEWVELSDRTKEWGNPDGTPRTTILDFDDTTDPAVLLQQTYDSLVDLARPKVQFRAEVQNIGWLNLGDRVIIVRFDQNIKYKARVYKIDRNILDEKQSTVEIGDYLVKSQAEREDETNQAIDNTNDKIDQESQDRQDADDQAKQDTDDKITDATDGLNIRIDDKVQYGPHEPTSPHEGDAWFKGDNNQTPGNAKYTMMMYRDGEWREVYPAGWDQKIRDDFKTSQDETEKLIQDAGFDSAKELYSQVSDNKDQVVSVKANLNGLQTTVSNNQIDTNSRFTQLPNLIDTKVTDAKNELSAQMTAKVNNGLASIQLSAGPGGLTLRSNGSSTTADLDISYFTVNGTSIFNTAWIKNAMIDSLSASKISGGDIYGINSVHTGQGTGSTVMSPDGFSTFGTLTAPTAYVYNKLYLDPGSYIQITNGYKGWGLYMHLADGDHHMVMD